MIDTADLYYNHDLIAEALVPVMEQLDLKRKDIFIVTKLRIVDLGYLK